MTEVSVHHVGTSGTILPHAVDHHTQQAAASLIVVVIKQLEAEEVVGRRPEVGVVDNGRHGGDGLLGIVLVARMQSLAANDYQAA